MVVVRALGEGTGVFACWPIACWCLARGKDVACLLALVASATFDRSLVTQRHHWCCCSVPCCRPSPG